MPDESETDAGHESSPAERAIIHASSVSFDGAAVLILGASGTGKSSLALELLSRGAALVSDDRTVLSLHNSNLVAEAPEAINGKIEARGIGILNALSTGPTPVKLTIDLDKEESARLPKLYTFSRFGVTVPLLYRVPYPHFAPAILQFLKAGRSHP